MASGEVRAGSRGDDAEATALRERALAVSRAAASELDGDVERANRLWEELVAARVSFVDRFESDGRRYLIARRSEAAAPISLLDTIDRLILAQRAGGLSLKVIACELGLSISAVGRRLRSCMTRLGVSNPAELSSLFGNRSR